MTDQELTRRLARIELYSYHAMEMAKFAAAIAKVVSSRLVFADDPDGKEEAEELTWAIETLQRATDCTDHPTPYLQKLREETGWDFSDPHKEENDD